MFGDGLNPHYFQNPPGFSYILHALYSVAYGTPPIGSHGTAIHKAFDGDPTTLYVIARVTSALMGLGAAWLLYFAGKRLYGSAVALVAAAFITFTFLPVHYSHFALNDVPTLLPLCLGLLGLAGITTKGRLLDYLIAGVGLGLATGTKYTAAALSVAIFIAWAIRAYDDREQAKKQFLYLVAAAGAALIAFVLVNPYAVLDAGGFTSGVKRQSDLSANVSKLGTDDTNGWFYYIKTFLWGYGIIPFLLALAGAALALKNDWRKSLPWVVFGGLVWLFMGHELRFYARWMMPVYPVLAIFSAYAVVEIGKWLAARFAKDKAQGATFATVGILAIALIGPLVHVVHNDLVLSRTDTRTLAKQWLLKNTQPSDKIVFELIGPKPYFRVNGYRGTDFAFKLYPLPSGTEVEKYAQTLSPALLNAYANAGYCYVVVGSIQKGRVTKDPSKAPNAAAYYKALDANAKKVATFSPIREGSKLPTFNFDISYNFFPLNYVRPGPLIDIYRLQNGKCAT
jgi:hypothetical protein